MQNDEEAAADDELRMREGRPPARDKLAELEAAATPTIPKDAKVQMFFCLQMVVFIGDPSRDCCILYSPRATVAGDADRKTQGEGCRGK